MQQRLLHQRTAPSKSDGNIRIHWCTWSHCTQSYKWKNSNINSYWKHSIMRIRQRYLTKMHRQGIHQTATSQILFLLLKSRFQFPFTYRPKGKNQGSRGYSSASSGKKTFLFHISKIFERLRNRCCWQCRHSALRMLVASFFMSHYCLVHVSRRKSHVFLHCSNMSGWTISHICSADGVGIFSRSDSRPCRSELLPSAWPNRHRQQRGGHTHNGGGSG